MSRTYLTRLAILQCRYQLSILQCRYQLSILQCRYQLSILQCRYQLSILPCRYQLSILQCRYQLSILQCRYQLSEDVSDVFDPLRDFGIGNHLDTKRVRKKISHIKSHHHKESAFERKYLISSQIIMKSQPLKENISYPVHYHKESAFERKYLISSPLS
jgi:hypothetical protein